MLAYNVLYMLLLDEPVREGMRLVFNNKFMRAKAKFQMHAATDPLHGVALGVIATIKAMMTHDQTDLDKAMSTLASAYTIAQAQIDAVSVKRSLKDSLTHYFSAFMVNKSISDFGPPAAPAPTTVSSSGITSTTTFLSNGVLRAHVIKAECSMLMAVMQLSRENVVDYLKCGLNLRRAYKSYVIVWQEYKRMGQEHTKHMDRDTVSAVYFGIGSIHLLISALPPKILKIFSSFGFTSDKELGLVLLKLCLEGKGIRSPLAAIMLLSYYSILTSSVPQLYSRELAGPAVECLLEAQKSFPSSCFFLYFAARIARIAGNLPLSLQSFSFAMDASRSEMMEVAMRHVTSYEIGWNHALQLDWESAAKNFEDLAKEKYSPPFCMYLVGACREMLGQRTQGILAFAEVRQQRISNNKSNGNNNSSTGSSSSSKDQQHPQQQQQHSPPSAYIESYVCKKVELFQKSGYQDMDINLPMLELMCIWNAFEQMEQGALEQCLEIVNSALNHIHERERRELSIRTQELAPSASPPDYYHHRALVLLIKASLLNALQRHSDSIPHLNWIMDNKEDLSYETAAWIIPFAYWEAGVTSWGLGNYVKARKLWQQGLSCSKYDFEYKMAIRFNLALSKCNDAGIGPVEKSATEKVLDMHAQKKAMSVVHPINR
ncbi:hypothetical protein BDB00DRAFT_798640 [Zychaea mexicana]|uniref:uncharacterized protein n=1 Tax=Zychaea mexicana TaxID=64656 RepID=UPI0022FE1C85|nr:uncharacterized protein BDB00DRAFT_798640 [Zychaea mexicana]KAI9498598.1 hypothetical protein BDB00DRAFT_798640 [Zychaea mexicana]